MRSTKPLELIIEQENHEGFHELLASERYPQLNAFCEGLQPMRYYENFPNPQEQCALDMLRFPLGNQHISPLDIISALNKVKGFVFTNGFDEKKALKQIERDQTIRRAYQSGHRTVKIYDIDDEYIGVVKAGVGTQAITMVERILQIKNIHAAIYIGTCVSLDSQVTDGITVVTNNYGHLCTSADLRMAQGQPDLGLSNDVCSYASDGQTISEVTSATLLGGYVHEDPGMLLNLYNTGIQVLDMESSIIIDRLRGRNVRPAVIQIPQDVLCQKTDIARTFNQGKQNVTKNIEPAMRMALYALRYA